MNSDYFSLTGWISVVVWGIVPLIWIFYALKGPRRWICPLALVLALLAFVLARHNSNNYVNLIQPDRSAELTAVEARKESSLKAFKESRGKDLSDVRFAEDGDDDNLDRAGMDTDDIKYYDRQDDSSGSNWKDKKKNRTAGGVDDGSVESALGGDTAIEGADSETLNAMQGEVPVTMMEEDLAKVNRLDALNLNIIYCLIVFGALMVLVDYLKRANIHGKASYPLPLPSEWINSMSPLPAVVELSGEVNLAAYAKRGDTFVYLTDDQSMAEKIPDAFKILPFFKKQIEVLRAEGEQGSINDDFIFESVWYGRGAFVVDTKMRSEKLLERFIEILDQRRANRAKVNQSVHLIWDIRQPIPEGIEQKLMSLGRATGFSLVLTKRPHS